METRKGPPGASISQSIYNLFVNWHREKLFMVNDKCQPVEGTFLNPWSI